MPRTISTAMATVIFALGVASSHAQAAAKFEGEECLVSIDIPDDRWTLTKARENTRRGWVRVFIRDSNRIANVRLGAEARRRHYQYATIDAWFEDRILKRLLEQYWGDYDHSILSTKKSTATLGSGEVVKVVEYYLDINDNSRNLRFAYFPNSKGTHWHFVQVYKSGVDRDLDKPFRKIIKGISLRR